MKSQLIALPIALALSVLVGRLVFQALHIPMERDLLLIGSLVFTYMMLNRTIFELGLIAALTGYGQFILSGGIAHSTDPDMLLAVIISLIMLPTMIRVLGMDVDLRMRPSTR